MRLGISIVTFKTDPQLLDACLGLVTSSDVKSQIYVIDNSPDSRLTGITDNYDCFYFHRPDNPGYGASHNMALKKSIENGLDYHLVLNADVSFCSDVIEKIMQFMDENVRVGQVMPKVLNPDGSIQRLCKLVPTPLDLLVRRLMPKSISYQMVQKFELWESGYNKTMFAPYLSGCFMFLRCSALKVVGIFDERYFMYPEDIDLTRRMAIKYETIYYPHTFVIHEHGAASYKSIRMFVIHSINIIRYFNKWGWFFDKDRKYLNRKTLSLLSKGFDR